MATRDKDFWAERGIGPASVEPLDKDLIQGASGAVRDAAVGRVNTALAASTATQSAPPQSVPSAGQGVRAVDYQGNGVYNLTENGQTTRHRSAQDAPTGASPEQVVTNAIQNRLDAPPPPPPADMERRVQTANRRQEVRQPRTENRNLAAASDHLVYAAVSRVSGTPVERFDVDSPQSQVARALAGEDIDLQPSTIDAVFQKLNNADLRKADVRTKRSYQKLRGDVTRLRRDARQAGKRLSSQVAEQVGAREDVTPAEYRAMVARTARGLPLHLRSSAVQRALASPPRSVARQTAIQQEAQARQALQRGEQAVQQEAQDAADAEVYELNIERYNEIAPEPVSGMSFEELKADKELYADYRRKMLTGALPFHAQRGQAEAFVPAKAGKGPATVTVGGQQMPVAAVAGDQVVTRQLQGLEELKTAAGAEGGDTATDGAVVLDNGAPSRIASQTTQIMSANPEMSLKDAIRQAAGADYDKLSERGTPPGTDREAFIRTAIGASVAKIEEDVSKRASAVVTAQRTQQATSVTEHFKREGDESAVADGMVDAAIEALENEVPPAEVAALLQDWSEEEVARTLGVEALIPGDTTTDALVTRIANRAMGKASRAYGQLVENRTAQYGQTVTQMTVQHGYSQDQAEQIAQNEATYGYAAFNASDAERRKEAQVMLDDKTVPQSLKDSVNAVIDASTRGNKGGVLGDFEQQLADNGIHNLGASTVEGLLNNAGMKSNAGEARDEFMHTPQDTQGVVNPMYAVQQMHTEGLQNFMATEGASSYYHVDESGRVVPNNDDGDPDPSPVFIDQMTTAKTALLTKDKDGNLPTIESFSDPEDVERYQLKKGFISPNSTIKLGSTEVPAFMAYAVYDGLSDPNVLSKLRSSDELVRTRGFMEAVSNFGTKLNGAQDKGIRDVTTQLNSEYPELFGTTPPSTEGLTTSQKALSVIGAINKQITDNPDGQSELQRRGTIELLQNERESLAQDVGGTVSALASAGMGSKSVKQVTSAIDQTLNKLGVATASAYGSVGVVDAYLQRSRGNDVPLPAGVNKEAMASLEAKFGTGINAQRIADANLKAPVKVWRALAKETTDLPLWVKGAISPFETASNQADYNQALALIKNNIKADAGMNNTQFEALFAEMEREEFDSQMGDLTQKMQEHYEEASAKRSVSASGKKQRRETLKERLRAQLNQTSPTGE